MRAMATKTENTAAVPTMLRQDKQDKYATENMMLYRTSLALLKNLAEDGTFTEKSIVSYRQCLPVNTDYLRVVYLRNPLDISAV